MKTKDVILADAMACYIEAERKILKLKRIIMVLTLVISALIIYILVR